MAHSDSHDYDGYSGGPHDQQERSTDGRAPARYGGVRDHIDEPGEWSPRDITRFVLLHRLL
jgi:hypothetical protein